jgi:hypothetical protein
MDNHGQMEKYGQILDKFWTKKYPAISGWVYCVTCVLPFTYLTRVAQFS